MAVTLNLEPEQERRLQEVAEARGLSVEGYLLTLVDAITDPAARAPRRGPLAAIGRRCLALSGETAPASLADSAARQMRAEVLAYKERAIEAVTKMNALRKVTEQQQRLIAEAELRALTLARNGEHEQALRSYQESCIHGQNLRNTRPKLEAAETVASELLTAFKKQESRMQARVSKPQAAAIAATQDEFAVTRLPEDRMDLRIFATAGAEQWQAEFAEWLQNLAPAEPNPTG